MVYVAAAAAMPLQGLLYLFTHPRLWPTFLCVAAVAISICILVIAGLGVAMPFIAFGLESVGCPGWLAWIVSVVIMLVRTFAIAVYFLTSSSFTFSLEARLRPFFASPSPLAASSST